MDNPGMRLPVKRAEGPFNSIASMGGRPLEPHSVRYLVPDSNTGNAECVVPNRTPMDSLTQLPTFAHFCERFEARIADRSTADKPAMLLCLDLDRFVRINDCFGYATGDALLHQVARRLESVLETSDFVGRVTQDEFVVAVDHIGNSQSPLQSARRILEVISRPFRYGNRVFYLTASIGIAMFPGDARDASELLALAQQAMRDARQDGRNTCRMSSQDNSSPTRYICDLERDLRKAIEREELFLLYQPIIELGNSRIRTVEALLRWRHPEAGVLSADSFLPAAHKSGLIGDVSDWALSHACSQVRRWHETGCPELSVAVNLPPVQFQPGQLAKRLDAVLAQTGLARQYLHVEVSSAGISNDQRRLGQVLHELHDAGIYVSLDNFGTGIFTPTNLKALPFDSLKIDRTIIRNIGADSSGQALAKALVLLGKSQDLTVEAEGIETLEQLDFITAEGCDRAQGFFLGRPSLPDDLARSLEPDALTRLPDPSH